MSAAITQVRLCAVPWSAGYKHIVRFTTRAAQSAYILGKTVKSSNACTIVRNDGYVRYPDHVDNLQGVNYLAFQNAGRWFYAFITRLQYVSDNTTWIYFDFDIVQNWMTEYSLGECFVVREHVTDDTVGANTVPEGLEIGDYIYYAEGSIGYQRANLGNLGIMIAVTEYWDGSAWQPAPGNEYNGVFSGVKLYHTTSATAAYAFLQQYQGIDPGGGLAPKAGAVVAVWMIPQAMLSSFGSTVTAVSAASTCESVAVTAPARPSVIDGYTPKNNKLLTYPYVCLSVDNNAGGIGVFKYEEFQATPAFSVYGGIMPNPSYKCFPTNLKNSNGAGNGLEYGLTLSGFPVCAWSNDAFSNWLAGNAGSLGLAAAGSAAALAGGIATGNAVMAGGGVAGIISQLVQVYQHSVMPDQMQGSLNSPSANVAKGWNDFYFHIRTIKAEYAKIIDEFFSAYGYKVNRIKIPNQYSATRNCNFVQCKDPVILGACPLDVKRQLENIYEQGVTIWHDGDKVGDYTL